MYKVGICGHFGFGKELVNGQTDKTMAVYNALIKALGREQVTTLDTCGWKNNPLAMLSGCRKLLESCENVIMMPARNGVKVFPWLFEFLNRNLGRKLHYVVVGGWLSEVLEADKWLVPVVKKLDKIYVEVEPLRDSLHRLGVENALYMPNFRETNALREDELIYNETMPYRLCTFSRVMREKGIEEAIEAVREVNRKFAGPVYKLDIYGKVEPDYSERFNELREGFEPFINYKGYITTEHRTEELKPYFAMLFPTVYEGEGFAGSIIDAFAAGVPTITTDWHYNSHIIRNGVDGIVYDPCRQGELAEILTVAANKPQFINSMKKECLKRAAHFEADCAVTILLNELGVQKEAAQV